MGGDAADAITDLSGLDWRAPSSTSPSSSGGDRGREGGKGRREPTGQRLWTSTAAWLVAQGQGETRWGDVLEPQQLTQVGGKRMGKRGEERECVLMDREGADME
jgi:hypothetical protein